MDAIKINMKKDKKAEDDPNTEDIEIEDFKAMLLKAQAAGPEDCEMCGS